MAFESIYCSLFGDIQTNIIPHSNYDLIVKLTFSTKKTISKTFFMVPYMLRNGPPSAGYNPGGHVIDARLERRIS